MVNPNISDRRYLIGTTLSLVEALNNTNDDNFDNNLTILKNLVNKISIEHFHLIDEGNQKKLVEGLEKLIERIEKISNNSGCKEVIKIISIFKSRISTDPSRLEIYLPYLDGMIASDMLNRTLLFFPDRGYPELARFVSRMLPGRIEGNIKREMIFLIDQLNSRKLKFSEIGIKNEEGIKQLMEISIKLKHPITRFYIMERFGKLYKNISYVNVVNYLLNSEFGKKDDLINKLILSINIGEYSIKKLCVRTMEELKSFMKLVQNAEVSLTRLDLSHIQNITDKDIQEISGKLQKLESLSISRSLITKNGLNSISTLSELKELNLSGCSRVYGHDLDPLAKLSKLEKISMVRLSPHRIGPNGELEEHTVDFQFLSQLSAVRRLRIEHCSCVVDSVINVIIKIKSIESLEILSLKGSCQGVIKKISRITQLKHLCLNHVEVEDKDFVSIGALANLESLDLSDTKAGGRALKAISKLDKLHSLSLRRCQGVHRQLVKLKGLSGILEKLDLEDIGNASVSDLNDILNCGFKSLRYLSFKSWNIGDDFFGFLKNVKTLEHLNIEGCKDLTSNGLKLLLGLSSLRLVEGYTCMRISPGLLDSINQVRYDR